MAITARWKIGLAGLIGIGALVVLFSGSEDGGYLAPQVSDSQGEPIGQFNRAKFADIVKSMKHGRLVLSVDKGLSDHEVRLKTGPRWQAQGEEARLRSARALWKAWAKRYPPSQRYRARIVIVDERGTKIGGSRLLNSAKIWVRKE